MDTIESSGVASTETQSFGFFEWLRSLIASLCGTSKGQVAPDHFASVDDGSDDADAAGFVIAPGGYRIRVPQADDVNHSVGQMLPAVKEGLSLLPPLPQLVVELLREIQDPRATTTSVAKVASTDPALAASLIRTVNGASMGLNRKITSVNEAISYLGFSTVKTMVVRLRLEDVLVPKSDMAAADMEDLWIHSLAVSYAADHLARRVPGVDAGFIATLGLLHDIGKLAIATQLSSQTTSAQVDASEDQLAREAGVFGVDHAGLGAELAARWKLPADLVQAIRWHHRAAEAFHPSDPVALRKALHIVQIANQLAKYCYPYSDHVAIDVIPNEVFELLGLEPSLTKLLDEKMQSAIGRAILFAQANSKRPVSAARRFLQPLDREDALRAIANGSAPSRVVQDQSAIDAMFADDAPSIQFREPATPAGIERCVNAILQGQTEMDLDADGRDPAAMVVRSLLPNLRQFSAPGESIEVAHLVVDRRYVLAVRTPGIGIERRLGEGHSSDQARRLAEADFAHVMNLGWFPKITVGADGSGVMFARS